MASKPVKERKARKVSNNRDYEARRQAKGMIRRNAWIPEADRETFVNAAQTYTRLHEERLERLKPST